MCGSPRLGCGVQPPPPHPAITPALLPALRHRFNSCSAHQELPDEGIDKLLEEEAQMRHVGASERPPLSECDAKTFEEDLVAFLRARGGDQLALSVKEKRIMW